MINLYKTRSISKVNSTQSVVAQSTSTLAAPSIPTAAATASAASNTAPMSNESVETDDTIVPNEESRSVQIRLGKKSMLRPAAWSAEPMLYFCTYLLYIYLYRVKGGKSDNWVNRIKITLCSVGTV